jgi:hypothetical protein
MVNQLMYHVGMGTDPRGLRSYCQTHGVVMQAYSPLGNKDTSLIKSPLLKAIGAAHNRSSVQVRSSNGIAIRSHAFCGLLMRTGGAVNRIGASHNLTWPAVMQNVGVIHRLDVGCTFLHGASNHFPFHLVGQSTALLGGAHTCS